MFNSSQQHHTFVDDGSVRIRQPVAVSSPDELFRSRSAPPSVWLGSSNSNVEEKNTIPTSDPKLYHLYQSQRRLNPRLPRPLYSNFVDSKKASPWSTPAPSILKEAATPATTSTVSSEKSSLISRIQQDFPRTASPIYSEQLTEQHQKHDTTSKTASFEKAFASMRVGQQPPQHHQQHGYYPTNTPHHPPFNHLPTSSNTYATQLAAAQAAAVSAQFYSQLAMNMSMMHQQQPSSSVTSTNSNNYHHNQHHHRRQNNIGHNNSRRGGGGGGGRGKRYNKEKENSRKIVTNLNLPPLGKGTRIESLAGHIVELSKDQYGSRFLQQKIDSSTSSTLNMIFEELQPHLAELMVDVFGNYVIQKILRRGSPKHVDSIVSAMNNNVLELALSTYGCRVVQTALDVIPDSDKRRVASELKEHVKRCVRDQNGNHVVQKIVENINSPTFVVATLLGEVYGFATHPYGCRVIQRILEYCSNMTETKQLMKEIETASLALMQDQYGNYVIQWMIEKGDRTQRERLVDRVRGNVLRFSQHKYASNVVECCLQHGTPSQRHDLVKEILTKDEAGITPLELMIKDPFANYVVQRILDNVDARQRVAVVNVIQSHAAHLKRFTYGKHILSKIMSFKIVNKKGGGNDAFMSEVKKM